MSAAISVLSSPTHADYSDPATMSEATYFRQPYSRYTDADHEVWRTLYGRQKRLLQRDVCPEFSDGLVTLALPDDRVPDFDAINRLLSRRTGWELVAVSGLLPNKVFFELLAARRFPVTWWLRSPSQLDYLEEPDLFHDLFGHVPMLCQPVFAEFMQRYGELGQAMPDEEHLSFLARLYWYTVEFGLIADSASSNRVLIYGAGIVSSRAECDYSLRSNVPSRVPFNFETVLQTSYRTDSLQKQYFVIENFRQLYDTVADTSDQFIEHCRRANMPACMC